MPLLQNQALIGTICVFDRIPAGRGEPAAFEERDVNLLVTLGTEAGIAIENARLFRAAAQRADELTALREVGQAIAGRLELPEVLEAIATGAMRLLGSQHSQILLWDEETQCLRYGSAVGSEAERVKGQSFVGSRGVNATVARTRQPLMVDDYQASPYAMLIREGNDETMGNALVVRGGHFLAGTGFLCGGDPGAQGPGSGHAELEAGGSLGRRAAVRQRQSRRNRDGTAARRDGIFDGTTRTWSHRTSRTDPAPSVRWAGGRGCGSTRDRQ